MNLTRILPAMCTGFALDFARGSSCVGPRLEASTLYLIMFGRPGLVRHARDHAEGRGTSGTLLTRCLARVTTRCGPAASAISMRQPRVQRHSPLPHALG